MPRKERRINEVGKDLAKSGSSAGQRKITDTFFATSSIANGKGVHDCRPNADTEIDAELDLVRSTDGESISIPPNTSEWSDNFDPNLYCIFDSKNFSETDRKSSRNKEGRFFQKDWLDNFQWLAYNREIKKAFCKVCADLAAEADKKRSPFANRAHGFSNWRKGMERLKEHDASELHNKLMKKNLILEKKDESIFCFINDSNKTRQQLRRAGMEASFSTLKTLLRQRLAIRCRDSMESHFFQFNKDKAEHEPGLKLLMEEKKMSNDVIAEMEKMIVLTARRHILRSINDQQFFALIADESADICQIKQISISFRTASEACDVRKEFIGIMPCEEGLTADELFSYITDVFLRCGVNNNKFIATSFDGASTMKSLAQKLKNRYGQQVSYIHCLAHCTELVV